MTLIVRWLAGHPAEWQKALTAIADGESIVVPSSILSDFVPKSGEGDMISVYELERDDDVEQVAAALAMSAPSFNRYAFAAVESADLDSIGLKYQFSPGATNNAQVDTWHRDLILPSRETINDLVDAFLGGDFLSVEKPVVMKTLENQIRENGFDWKAVASVKPFQQRLAGYVNTSLKIEGISLSSAKTNESLAS